MTAGAPTVRVPTAWTYGAASGVTATSTAGDRAFALENGAMAILDPQGGTATLNEAVSGEGTLAITNGTLVLNAASTADGATVAVSGGAKLQINADQTLAGLSLATGATVTVSSAVTLDSLVAAGATIDLESNQALKFTGDANVQDVEFACGSLSGVWRTLVRAAGAIVGAPAHAERYNYRTKTVDGVALLQVRCPSMMIIFR